MPRRIDLTVRSQTQLLYWAWAFAAAYFCSYYFLIKLLPLPSAMLSAEEVANFYQVNRDSIRAGAAICSWTAGFTIPLAIVIAAQMARIEPGFPIWSIVQLTGGVMMSIFIALPPMFWGVAAFTPERPPEVTLGFHEWGNLAFISTAQYFIFQFVATAVICLTKTSVTNSAFPRWFGYLSLWAALTIEIGVAAYLTKSGPFAWNGLFVYWIPLSMYGVWFMLVSYFILRALKKQAPRRRPMSN